MDTNGSAGNASPSSPSALISSLSGLTLEAAGDTSQQSDITIATNGRRSESGSERSITGPVPDETNIARSLDEAQVAVKAVSSHIFAMEERMHTGSHFSEAADTSPPSSPAQIRDDGAKDAASEREIAFIKLDELLEHASKRMRVAQSGLEAREKMEVGGDEEEREEEEDAQALAHKQRNRRGSLSSLDSFASIDDDFPVFGTSEESGSISVKALRKRYDEACTAWSNAHADAEKLKAELLDTQYVRVFRRNASEIDEHYGSLSRAVEAANTLVYRANEQRVNISINRSNGSASSALYDDDKETLQGLLSEAVKLHQTINVKRQYYLNSDEQLLAIMARSIADRANPNGAIVRQLEDLQTRHKAIKDSLRRAERNLERSQVELEELLGITSDQGSSAPGTSSESSARGYGIPSSSHYSTPTRPLTIKPKSSRRNITASSSTPSPATSHKALSPTFSPPTKPQKSPHRMSTSGDLSFGSSVSSSGTPRRYNPSGAASSLHHARSFSASVQNYQSNLSPASARLDSKRSSRNLGAGSVTPLGQSYSPSSRPAWNSSRVITRDEEEEEERQQYLRREAQRVESQQRLHGSGTFQRRGSGASSSIVSNLSSGRSVSGTAPRWSPERPFRTMSPGAPPTSYRAPTVAESSYAYPRRSKTPQPQPTWTRGGSEPPPSSVLRPPSRTGSTSASVDPPAHTAPLRPGSSLAFYRGSAADSSSPSRGAPTISRNGTFYRPPPVDAGQLGDEKRKKRDSYIPRLAFSHDSPTLPERAGSSRVPRPSSALSQNSSVSAISAISTGPPPAHLYKGASRLSMQTPEPQIAARATRMSMFARPSGKPPPSKSAAANTPTGARRVTPAGGRATPLSAAALAAVPQASVLPPRAGANVAGSASASSVQNFRAAQIAAAGGSRAGSHYSPATSRDGANTPTLSEGGASSVGAHSAYTYGGSSYGMRRSIAHPRDLTLRQHVPRDAATPGGGKFELYRPNRHDLLDVEVAAIVNREGASLEMVDPPLPKGARREVGPGKDCQARYNIAGKVVACRLLELHPAGSTLRGIQPAKKRKIQVRVGGGWQELESWLLSRLGG